MGQIARLDKALGLAVVLTIADVVINIDIAIAQTTTRASVRPLFRSAGQKP
jgi:hypothetical protein